MSRLKNIGSETTKFAKEIETEARRITWPSRQEALKSTLAVVIISAILASFLGVVDYAFSYVIRFILG